MGENYTIQEANIRMCRTASLTLNTTWQTLVFDGTCTYNENTFGIDPTSGNKMVWWDSVNSMFKFIADYDYNAIMSLYLSTTANLVTLRSSLRMRIVVPNGVSPGVPLYIPFPELGAAGAYIDAGEVTLLANGVNHQPIILPLKINSAIRTNGFYIQLQLSNSLITLGVCTLTSANIRIQQ